MAWLSDGEKNFDDRFIRFDTTNERDRQTNTHTYTQTVTALMHRIARQKLL